MPPALGDQRSAFDRQHAERKAKIARQRLHVARLEIDPPDRAAAPKLHQIVLPALKRMLLRSDAGQQRVGSVEGERRHAVERPPSRRCQNDAVMRAAADNDLPAGQGGGERAALAGEARHRRFKGEKGAIRSAVDRPDLDCRS